MLSQHLKEKQYHVPALMLLDNKVKQCSLPKLIHREKHFNLQFFLILTQEEKHLNDF